MPHATPALFAATLLALLLTPPTPTDAHGSMRIPAPRNAGVHARASDPVEFCDKARCMFFSQGCTIGCKCNEDNAIADYFNATCPTAIPPRINSSAERTFSNLPVPLPNIPTDWSYRHPWRAPGTSIPLNSCGLAGGSTKNNDIAGGYGNMTVAGKQGFPGDRLPPVLEQTQWTAGEAVEVAWTIAANHGGGYIYRLCPAEQPLTEDCFWKTPLPFVGSTQRLRWADGHEVEIPATRVSGNTFPANSTWTRNPIPACQGPHGGYQGKGCDLGPAFPPPPGCNDTCWGFQPCLEGEFPGGCPGPIKVREQPMIVDRVLVPPTLPPGKYVISWRWDCEQSPQIWTNCGDITVLAATAPAAAAAPNKH